MWQKFVDFAPKILSRGASRNSPRNSSAPRSSSPSARLRRGSTRRGSRRGPTPSRAGGEPSEQRRGLRGQSGRTCFSEASCNEPGLAGLRKPGDGVRPVYHHCWIGIDITNGMSDVMAQRHHSSISRDCMYVYVRQKALAQQILYCK